MSRGRLVAVAVLIALGAGLAARRACGFLRLRGKAAPALSLPALAGPPVTLAARRGRVVVLDFWATWCPPCRAELPVLESLARKLEPRGVEFYAVNVGEPRETVRGFVRETGLRMTVLLDDGSTAAAWGFDSLPALAIVDRDGQVAETVLGAIGESDLARLIEPLLD